MPATYRAHSRPILHPARTVWLAMCCVLSIATAAAEAAPRLFVDAPLPAAAAAASQTRAEVIRHRGVRLDMRRFADAPATIDIAVSASSALELNLFADVLLEVLRDGVERGYGGATIWKGHVAGADTSEVTLVVRDGVMIGNVRSDGRQYAVRYAGDGVHTIEEIDASAFPPCGASLSPDSAPPSQDASVLSDAAAAAPDDGSIIDIMVVYTPNARAAVGGTIAMENHVNLAIAESNTGLANSNVVHRFNLVHTEEVAYTSGGDFLVDLNRLTNPSDGFMDNVHTLRNTFGADAVSLFTDATAFCGFAWIMQTPSAAFAANAFNVVRWSCATGNFSFAHEFGHNFGCAHDRANASVNGSFTYSFGWRNAGVNRTIMALNTGCGCTRVNYWSNPGVTVSGFAMGFNAADPAQGAHNALSLDNNRSIVANWRQHVATEPTISWVTPPPAAAVGSQIITVRWNLSGFAGPIAENQVHYGITSVLFSSSIQFPANGPAFLGLKLPNIGTFQSPTTYKFICRALDNGVQVLSPIVSTVLSAGPTPATVTWVTPPPASAPSGGQFTVQWRMTDFLIPAAQNAAAWGITSILGTTGDQPGGNGIYTALVNVPAVGGSGTLFYTAFADNGFEFAFAPITGVLITVP